MSNKYGPKIVTDGLVFCIDASDIKSYPGSGTTWKDRSGNSYDCLLSNSPVYTLDYKGGFIFDGANTLCRSTLPVSDLQETFTVCVWFSVSGDTNVPNTSNRLISADSTSGSTKWAIGINSSTQFQVAGAGGSDGEPSFPVTLNVPYFACFICHDVSSYSLFLNDTKELTNESFSVTTADFGNIGIACRPNSTDRIFDGTVYSVAMYNRNLTDQEVSQNYNAIKGRFGY